MLGDRTRSRRRLSRRASIALGGSTVALVIASGTAAVSAVTSDSDAPQRQAQHAVAAEQVAGLSHARTDTKPIADFNAVRQVVATGTWHVETARVTAKLRAQRAHKRAMAAKRAAHRRAVAARKAAKRRADRSTPAVHTPAHQGAKPKPKPTHTSAPAPAQPSGSPQTIAKSLLGGYGWSASQFSCLQPLWDRESGWNVHASNPSSGAYGIPQALPGSKMASAGPNWRSNATTQIKWGLGYIKDRYGSPCAAWQHSQSTGWY